MQSALHLDRCGVRTLIYNHQLCVMDPHAWPFAVNAVSDWKNEYDAVCSDCAVDRRGGFFAFAKYKTSADIRAVALHTDDEHGGATGSGGVPLPSERATISAR